MLKNRDCPVDFYSEEVIQEDETSIWVTRNGLTKREYAAIAAMKGFMSTGNVEMNSDDTAIIAVSFADALFDRLEKTNKKNESND